MPKKTEAVEKKLKDVEANITNDSNNTSDDSMQLEGTNDKEQKPKKEKKEKLPTIWADPIEPLTKIVYPYVCVSVCGTPEQHGLAEDKIQLIQDTFKQLGLDNLISYAPPLTAIDAESLLGWEVEQDGPDKPKFKDGEWSVRDYYGKKVRLHKNIRNRPIYPANLEVLQQSMLMGQWQLNGEPTIISDVGNVQDNQHTLIALKIAQQRLDYEKDTTGNLRWASKWPTGIISIPKIIVYGIKGTDEVVNSMNTGRPRSFADVLYRSSYFDNLPYRSEDGLDRQTAARVTDHAVREVWQRTGLYLDGYSSRRTNSEGAAWIESHGGMEGYFLQFVRFILEQDVHGHISDYIHCGKAVCLLWLSAAGDSDKDKYYVLRNEDRDSEAYTSINWKYLDTAKKFWEEFGDREPSREVDVIIDGQEGKKIVKGKSRGPLKALTDLLDEMNKSDEPMIREKDFVIARAWNLWLEEKPITTASVRIKDTDYDAPDDWGIRHLKKTPKVWKRFGNLDLGMDRLKQERNKELIDPQRQEEINKQIEDDKKKKVEDFNTEALKKLTNNDPEDDTTTKELSSIKPQSQKDCEELHIKHPELQIIFVKTYSDNMETWGPSAKFVGDLLASPADQHPNNSYRFKMSVSSWEDIANKVTDKGYSIGLGDRVDNELQIIMALNPSKPTGGAGQKRR